MDPRILYYPNFNSKDLKGIKHSLLLCEKISVIAPTMTPRYRMPLTLTPAETKEPPMINPHGVIDANLFGIVNIIDDYQIAEKHSREFVRALEEDLNDPEIDTWEREWKQRYGGRDHAWFVDPAYFHYFLKIDIKPEYGIEKVPDKKFGELLKFPFRVGMSLGLSEALWGAIDNDCTLFTVDAASTSFLMLRLKRGWKHLAQAQELQDQLDLEPEFAKRFATAELATWTLGLKVPGLFQELDNLTVKDILTLRENSDQKGALESFRTGIAEIVTSTGLWKINNFREFKNEAYHIIDKTILPAFKALEEKRDLSLKEIFTAFDAGAALSEIIKAIPKLFVSTPAASAAGTAGGLALYGGIHLVPAALFALGCGIAAGGVKEFITGRQNRNKELAGAQFLTYPLQVQTRLNNK